MSTLYSGPQNEHCIYSVRSITLYKSYYTYITHFSEKAFPTMAVQQRQHVDAVVCRTCFSGLVGLYVFDNSQIPRGCIAPNWIDPPHMLWALFDFWVCSIDICLFVLCRVLSFVLFVMVFSDKLHVRLLYDRICRTTKWCAYVCMCVCMYVCLCMYVCVCMYFYFLLYLLTCPITLYLVILHAIYIELTVVIFTLIVYSGYSFFMDCY